jgi:hypothetical protein
VCGPAELLAEGRGPSGGGRAVAVGGPPGAQAPRGVV